MIGIYDLATGRVLRLVDCPEHEYDAACAEGEGWKPLGTTAAGYFDGDDFVPIGDPPTLRHAYDWTARKWVAPLTELAADVSAKIDREFKRRDLLPVTVAGVPFDADAAARENISGTAARIERGDALPAGWVGWRDADNAMHWADAMPAAVLANLNAVSRAIEDRKQALLVARWTKKAQIAAIADEAELLAFDIGTDWPA